MDGPQAVSCRTLIRQSFEMAAGLGLWGTSQSWAGVGIRGHGFGSHIRNRPLLRDVEVAAIREVDERLFPERLRWLEQNGKSVPKTCIDIRKLFEVESIDAIRANDDAHKMLTRDGRSPFAVSENV
jgi:hypothetical protein